MHPGKTSHLGQVIERSDEECVLLCQKSVQQPQMHQFNSNEPDLNITKRVIVLVLKSNFLALYESSSI